jgi:putative ABC transport system substrate-binding protein
MIRELLPDAKTIGIIYNTGEDNSLSTMKDINAIAGDFGFEIIEAGVTAQSEVPAAADTIISKGVDTVYMITDNTAVSMLSDILAKTNAAKIPVFGSEETQVEAGAVATEGIEYFALGKVAGKMAATILKGDKAASDIKFEYFTEFHPYINSAAAEIVGLTIPQSMLDAAQQVFDTIKDTP